jgi:transposase
VRERLVSQRTGIINQIRAFLLERGFAVRQGQRFLRAELPRILGTSSADLSPNMAQIIEDLASDWRRLDERIDRLSAEIEGGLVPRQISTGDRTILGKISKRGNRYLRVLFVQAAWVVLIKPKIWERRGLKLWIEAAKKRLHPNVLAIALANKLARIAWSVLARGRDFEASTIAAVNAQSAYLPASDGERETR